VSLPSDKIQQFYGFKPIRFNLLSRVEWTAVPSVPGYALSLELQLTSSKDIESELVMHFEGVRNLRFTADGVAQPLLEIKDVSARQWDGVTYEVRDREHDTICFLCRDFSASLRETST
jgi:hypothetical protein